MQGHDPEPARHEAEDTMSEQVAVRERGWSGGLWTDEASHWRMEPYYEGLVVDRPTTSTILKARVVAAIHRSGKSISAVSKAAGLLKSGLGRRLSLKADCWLYVDTLDAIGAALELEPDDLMRPVLLGGDQYVLAHLAATKFDADGEPIANPIPPHLTEGTPTRWLECCIARLRSQGLIRPIAGGWLPTPLGFQAAVDPTLRNV